MKAYVNQKLCQTAGKCVQICPEIFTFEAGSKKAVAKQTNVPKILEEKCRRAAAACPVNAIIIT